MDREQFCTHKHVSSRLERGSPMMGIRQAPNPLRVSSGNSKWSPPRTSPGVLRWCSRQPAACYCMTGVGPTPIDVYGNPLRPAAPKGGLLTFYPTTSRPPEPGIQGIPESIAEQVEGQHGQRNRESRKKDEPPAGYQGRKGIRQHVAPVRCGWRDSNTKKPKAGFDNSRLFDAFETPITARSFPAI